MCASTDYSMFKLRLNSPSDAKLIAVSRLEVFFGRVNARTVDTHFISVDVSS